MPPLLSTSRPCAATVINFSYQCHQCYPLLIPMTPLISTSRPCATNDIISSLCHHSYQFLIPVPPMLSTFPPSNITLTNSSFLCHRVYRIVFFVPSQSFIDFFQVDKQKQINATLVHGTLTASFLWGI